nr:egl nine homolog 1-like isoform X4 [Procambarus clarkii]
MTTVLADNFGCGAYSDRRFICARRMNHGVKVRVCGVCSCEDDHLKVCGRCKAAWYCSPDHQRQHWKHHKPFCKPKNGVMPLEALAVKSRKTSKRQQAHTDFSLDRSVLDAVACSQGTVMSDYGLQFQGSGGCVEGVRRRSLAEPDLSTPIDSSNILEASSQHFRPKTPSLYHVEVCPDSQSLEEGVISQEWFSRVMQLVMSDLNKYGVCVVDQFLGEERAEQILKEVGALHSCGVFQDGQVVSRQVQDQARGMIRGDKITWVTGSEPNCTNIGKLVTRVDSVVAKVNKHQDAGKLAHYNITWRTRAMVACYPGRDAHYVKHVDNPNGDGRCITAIYYINKDWTPQDGGVLRIYPKGCSDQVAEIEPLFDRMLFFWSDRRNPHEVLPAKITRYAITVWYLDQKEREDYLARVSNTSSNT